MTPEQAQALRQSAINIIAHENQLEAQRTKLYNELERANTNARQAVMMAAEAEREGDAAKAANFNESAGIIAEEIVRIDTQIAAIDVELIEAKQASEEAKSIASTSALEITQMKSKGAALRADFERAKMAEASVEASSSPSFDQVADKINQRSAAADAMAEVDGVENDNSMAEATAMVESAAAETAAAAKLAEIRGQLGLMSDQEPVADAPEPQHAAPPAHSTDTGSDSDSTDSDSTDAETD